jgi:hypothetical protein
MPLRFSSQAFNVGYQAGAPGRRVTEKSHFSMLNVGLAGTGNQTQDTCFAGIVTRRLAIHYAFIMDLFIFYKLAKRSDFFVYFVHQE